MNTCTHLSKHTSFIRNSLNSEANSWMYIKKIDVWLSHLGLEKCMSSIPYVPRADGEYSNFLVLVISPPAWHPSHKRWPGFQDISVWHRHLIAKPHGGVVKLAYHCSSERGSSRFWQNQRPAELGPHRIRHTAIASNQVRRNCSVACITLLGRKPKRMRWPKMLLWFPGFVKEHCQSSSYLPNLGRMSSHCGKLYSLPSWMIPCVGIGFWWIVKAIAEPSNHQLLVIIGKRPTPSKNWEQRAPPY